MQLCRLELCSGIRQSSARMPRQAGTNQQALPGSEMQKRARCLTEVSQKIDLSLDICNSHIAMRVTKSKSWQSVTCLVVQLFKEGLVDHGGQ